MKPINNIYSYIAAAAVAIMVTGCAADEPETTVTPAATEQTGDYVYRLELKDENPSRSVELNVDGAMTFFSFVTGDGERVPAYAVFSEEKNSWELHTDKDVLSANTFGKVDVYYLGQDYTGGINDGKISFTSSGTGEVYGKQQATYTTFGDNSVSVTATLEPLAARLRVKLSSYSTSYYYYISGVDRLMNVDLVSGELETTPLYNSVSFSKADDGYYYTKYIPVSYSSRQNQPFVKFFNGYNSTVYWANLAEGASAEGMLDDGNTITLFPGSGSTGRFTSSSYYTYSPSSFNVSSTGLGSWSVKQIDYTSSGSYCGLSIKCTVKVNSIVEDNQNAKRRFGFRCSAGSYSADYDPFENEELEVGKSYDIYYSFYFPAGPYTKYYMYLLYDGIDATVSSITVTNRF